MVVVQISGSGGIAGGLVVSIKSDFNKEKCGGGRHLNICYSLV